MNARKQTLKLTHFRYLGRPKLTHFRETDGGVTHFRGVAASALRLLARIRALTPKPQESGVYLYAI